MKVGDLVKLHGSEDLGIGIVTALYSGETAFVYFPNCDETHSWGLELWRERLEVVNETTSG